MLLLLLLSAVGCASHVGPKQHELASALGLAVETITAPRCYAIPEEPTEFGCSYRQQGTGDNWNRQEVMVAIDGPAWVIIHGPGPPQ
jgi:hypothetical protein